MGKPQIIRSPEGEELVVLPRDDYDDLVARAACPTKADEDAGTAHIVADSSAALAGSRDVELPAAVAEAIARGENPIRVIRKWRGMTQLQLAAFKTNIGQGYLSDIENGRRRGSPTLLKRLAEVLGVPMDLLVE